MCVCILHRTERSQSRENIIREESELRLSEGGELPVRRVDLVAEAGLARLGGGRGGGARPRDRGPEDCLRGHVAASRGHIM